MPVGSIHFPAGLKKFQNSAWRREFMSKRVLLRRAVD
jgi:hypothetical protein